MKIIIPSYSLPDNFTENVAITLRMMGHEVLTAPVPVRLIDQRVMHVMQLGFEKLALNVFTPQERWLRKSYKDFKPQVMIALTHSVNEELLLELRRSGVVNVAWWGDTPANMRNQGLLCYGWDHIFMKDRYAVFKLNTLGLNAHFLPEAMNPLWHKPMYTSWGEDIVFAGNTYEYRHFLLRRMLERGCENIKLYGNRPPRWADNEVKKLFQGKFVVKEEKSLIFGSAAVCVNSTSVSEGNSINCRTFEIAGAGGLQIMEYRQAIEDCFDPGREILTYSGIDDLIEKISVIQADRPAATAIRERAASRSRAEHTYQHRLTDILNFVRG